MRLEELVNNYSDNLNKTDFAILKYAISNKTSISDMSIEDMSKYTFTSTASIVRFCKKLGFSGFSEFKYFIRHDISNQKQAISTSINSLEEDILETLKLVSQTNLLPICEAIGSAKKILVFGTDWGEKIAANNLARNFMACGVLMNTIPSITEMNWLVNTLTKDDLVIIISFSGNSSSLKKLVNILKLNSISFISITPLSKNLLSSQADFNLYYKFTDLNIDGNPLNEYNFYISLNILTEMLFRYYHDFIYNSNQ